jgi:RND family efflux transporter MFP subunit
MFFKKLKMKQLYICAIGLSLIGCDANTTTHTHNQIVQNQATPITRFDHTEVAMPIKTVPEQHFFGRVQGSESYNMALFVDGRIERVLVKEGQIVNSGDVLATLYSPNLAQRVTSRESRYESAKAILHQAKIQQQRSSELVRKKLQPNAVLDDANRALKVATQEVNNALAQLEEAKNQQRETQLVASQTGVVGKLYSRSGDYINAGENIVRFESSETLKVVFSLPERIAISLPETKQVQVSFPSIKTTLIGTVTEKSLPIIGQPALFEVTVTLPKSNYEYLGVTAKLHVPISDDRLYKVSHSALRYDQNNQAYLLSALENNTLPVTVIAVEKDGVLISSVHTLLQPISLVSEIINPLNLAVLDKG